MKASLLACVSCTWERSLLESASDQLTRTTSPLPPNAVAVCTGSTAGPTTSARNVTGTDTGTPPRSGGRPPAPDQATTTATVTPPPPARRRRRSSTGSRSRSPRSTSSAWQAPPNRPVSPPPRPTEVGSISPSKPPPPASPERFGAAGGDHHHHHHAEIAPPCAGGGRGSTSPAVVSSPAHFADGGSGAPQPQQRERHEPPPARPVEADAPRTIRSCLASELEWYPLCQDGFDSFTRTQVLWAVRMIAEVCDGVGAPTEILALAAMTLGVAFGEPALLETSLRPGDLFLVPAACVLDALCRNPAVCRFNPEEVVDTMVSVAVAAKGDDGDGDGDRHGGEGGANGTKARLLELRGMVELAVPDGRHWAGPIDFILEFIQRSGVRSTMRTAREIRGSTEAFIRSSVLNGDLEEFTPSELACSAFFGATDIMISFDDDGEEEDGPDHDGQDYL